jgi:hypothetical protein
MFAYSERRGGRSAGSKTLYPEVLPPDDESGPPDPPPPDPPEAGGRGAEYTGLGVVSTFGLRVSSSRPAADDDDDDDARDLRRRAGSR